MKDILNDESITYCYIKRHGSYYRTNCCGYTDNKEDAGVYTKEKAVSEAKSCGDLIIIPIDVVEYNEFINYKIDGLKLKIEELKLKTL